jgi:hypothetical protein
MDYKSDFEYDLAVGMLSEKALGEILDNKTIEVKSDIKARDTGNLFIEYESRGKPSGISRTKADFYCFDIGHLFILIETQKLKDIIRPLLGTSSEKLGGDENTSKGILLPLTKILKP